MGVRIRKIEERFCDISNRPLKEGEETRENYVVGDKSYDEVSLATVEKIEAFVVRLGVPPKPRAKRTQ